MKIGELAQQTGVSVRALRYYEQRELLTSGRTAGGQRIYADGDVDRVVLIQHLFGAGLTSADVVQLLPCVYSGTTTPAMIERLEVERERLDAQITELSDTRDRLDTVLVEARHRLRRTA